MMKIWMLAILFSIAPTVAAEEQSKEESLKEINNAFDRVYKAKQGKSLAQQIPVLRELSKEYSETPSVQDFLLQEIGTIYSFIGLHHSALAAFDKRGGEPESLNSDVKNLSAINAYSAVAERAKDHQVIMINEAHHIPQHRVFTYQLLDDLWGQGFRYLAIEALGEKTEQRISEDFVPTDVGFYTEEPIFAKLIAHAKRLGFQLVSYDYGSPINSGTEAREKAAVDNLREKIFSNDDDARVVVHVGYSHIREDTWLAHYIRERLSIDPLTINQTDIREKSEQQYESETYRWLTTEHSFEEPVILENSKGEAWSLEPEKYDLNVVWPRAMYELNRPRWARLGRDISMVDPKWCKNNFPCTIEVFHADEEGTVPADRVAIYSDKDKVGFYHSSGASVIKVRGPQGQVIHTQSVL